WFDSSRRDRGGALFGRGRRRAGPDRLEGVIDYLLIFVIAARVSFTSSIAKSKSPTNLPRAFTVSGVAKSPSACSAAAWYFESPVRRARRAIKRTAIPPSSPGLRRTRTAPNALGSSVTP